MSRRPRLILLVDDSAEDREAYRRFLLQSAPGEFTVREADRASQAATLAAELRPDVIVLDYSLPDHDGLALIRTLRDTTDAAVVMLTGMGDEQLAVEAMRAGAHDYLPKSVVSPVVLLRAVQGAMERLRLERERHAILLRLTESEGRLARAQAAARAGIWEWEVGSGVIHSTPALRILYGMPPGPDQFTYAEWLALVHPDDRPRAEEATRLLQTGQRRVFDLEYRIQRPDGLRWLTSRGDAMVMREGRVLRVAGVDMDITDRKRAEEQMRLAQRMQAVGRLAGGVAHEVNNMMTVVVGAGAFALGQLADDAPVRPEIETMVSAATRAAGITRQLLAFTRQQILQPVKLSLTTVVREAAPLLERLLGNDRQLELRLPADPAPVLADRAQLEQVLVNLVSNARDALRAVGRVTLEVTPMRLDDTYARLHPQAMVHPGDYVLLAVHDDGCGMTDEVRERAFEPFYTTREVGDGAGLGLSTAYGIVKQSGGYIWLHSAPELGTSAMVFLPRAEPLPAREGQPDGSRTCTVLVVEDEPAVRLVARRALEGDGFRVVEAASGQEARRALHVEPLIDLVLADVVLTDTVGTAIGALVAATHPGVRVLFMSGYAGEEMTRRGLLAEGAPFVPKPFAPDALVARVREELASGTAAVVGAGAAGGGRRAGRPAG